MGHSASCRIRADLVTSVRSIGVLFAICLTSATRSAAADEPSIESEPSPEPPPPSPQPGPLETPPPQPAPLEQQLPPPVERHVEPQRWLWVEAQLGLGTPLGYLGGGLAVQPIPRISVHAGGGLGQLGPQLAAGARFRIPTASSIWSLGASWSTGTHANHESFDAKGFCYWSRAHVLNAEGAISPRLGSGRWAPRAFAGFGWVVNGDDAACSVYGSNGGAARAIPYFGLGGSFGVL